MSWRLTFDSAPSDDKHRHTISGQKSDASNRVASVSLLYPLFGVLVDIGCRVAWLSTSHEATTNTDRQPADTGATHQIVCVCVCVRVCVYVCM